jgi:DNA-binding PadR family transcriptional regulator
MSVRDAVLALLSQSASYGYQLKHEFERRTGATWVVNVGQVYQTLERLQRDGLIEHLGADEEGHQLYAATEAGREDARRWLREPLARPDAPRNDLAMKIALASTLDGVDVRAVIQTQRLAVLAQLQELTRSKAAVTDPDSAQELAWQLSVDAAIFRAESEARWLDHAESRLDRLRERGVDLVQPLLATGPRGRPAQSPASAGEEAATAASTSRGASS